LPLPQTLLPIITWFSIRLSGYGSGENIQTPNIYSSENISSQVMVFLYSLCILSGKRTWVRQNSKNTSKT
jgi:hypothetical protein